MTLHFCDSDEEISIVEYDLYFRPLLYACYIYVVSSEISETFAPVPFSIVDADTVETLVGKKKLILCHLPM